MYLITQHDSQPKEKVQRILNAGLEGEVRLGGLLSEGLWDAQHLCKYRQLASENLFAWHGKVQRGDSQGAGHFHLPRASR